MSVLENPMGLDGFEFVEFAAEDTQNLVALFERMGFSPVAKHKTKAITLYKQGDVIFVINSDPNSFSVNFSKQHGPCAASMAFRVKDAKAAYDRAISLGATPYEGDEGEVTFDTPVIRGIGGSLLYLVDKYGDSSLYDPSDFVWSTHASTVSDFGLDVIDHLTHNVHQGHMDEWADYYRRLFNFKQIRFFDIDGSQTGLISRALASPCGKIKIPLNESKDEKSQIEEYLREYKGEGIQHIALSSKNIYESVEGMKEAGTNFLTIPDTYYEVINKRMPGHSEDIERMKKSRILMDGDAQSEAGILLQIFTENVIGPIFFEIIQRKGNDGFGEGNFTALFESIEIDQIRRGVLSAGDD
jgi:4-hydroxyphenylpyruvate dioxygenase